MTGDVRESKILRTEQLDRWSLVQRIVLFTHEASVFDGFVTHVMHVLSVVISVYHATQMSPAELTVFVQIIPT
jgi:uncharacterized membrane protein required for colicin V production